MELPALKVGKPRPTPVVRGGITRYHFNKMEEVYYNYEDGEEVVVPLSESAYIAFDVDEHTYKAQLKGRRKKMTIKEKTLYEETAFTMKKIWTEGVV